ncbi:Cyclic nucleotide-binding-like [Trinorchestia longiramus]|nr:Cyclic nucleotide-binding-like [Trinorchestia longiramus]
MGSRRLEDYHDDRFIDALKVPPGRRSIQDLEVVYRWLRGMEALCWLREAALRALARTVRYEVHNANDILYCRGELATCWYILLRGSVFIDGSMFLPRSRRVLAALSRKIRRSALNAENPSYSWPPLQVFSSPEVSVLASALFARISNQDATHHCPQRPCILALIERTACVVFTMTLIVFSKFLVISVVFIALFWAAGVGLFHA